jgi:hypothetical protein
MNNPFNKVPMTPVGGGHPDLTQIVQQAMQNPKAFEEMVKQNNPAAYQQACQLRNSMSPQMLLQTAQAKGINPAILKMLGLG